MDIKTLRALGTDQRLEELNGHVSSLSLVRALGAARDEVAHSRLLADLLDPRRHRGAADMLGVFLHRIVERHCLKQHVAERLRAIAEAPWKRIAVRRELFWIDVVVEATAAQSMVVVGIENKIDAAEQPQQIGRYQEVLRRAYPDRTAIVVFLTPTGREPTTARADSPVPAVAVGYESVLAAVEAAQREAVVGSRDERILGEVAAHLEEDILGSPEVKALVHELWRTHGRALRLAFEHRPRLSDIQDSYVRLLKERFGEDALFRYYPEKRGDLRGIKMSLASWQQNGFPFTFMLYAYKEGRPHVRVLIWRDDYRAHAASLAAWARRVNASAGPLIDEEFTPLSGWGYWCRVFREEDYPPDAALDEEAFDEDTARAAVDTVSAHVEQLRPYVEATKI